MANELPPLGSASRGLRVISETWNATRNQLTIEISGPWRPQYEMSVWNPSQVTSVDGAALDKRKAGNSDADRRAPDSYVSQKVIFISSTKAVCFHRL